MQRSGRAAGLVVALLAALPVAAQQLCDRWQLVNPLPSNRDLRGATHGEGGFVAVGSSGTVLTSTDEASWQMRGSPTDASLNDVEWTGSLYVAVGDEGSVVTSADGDQWIPRPTGSTENLLAVAAGGPSVVAVGTAGEVITSPDGVQWARQQPPVAAELRGIAWTGTEYLVVGEPGDLLASVDGVTWSQRTVGLDGPFTAIASSGTVTVVVAEDGDTAVSDDGMTWAQGVAARPFTEMVWVGDRFIGAGGESPYSHDGPKYSFDGLSWRHNRTSALGFAVDALASDGTVTVAAGQGGHIVVTRDGGEHYKLINTVTGLSLYGVAANSSGAVLAAGTVDAWRGDLFASRDFVNYEVVYHMGLEALYDVAASDQLFVAVGVINELWSGGGMILRSLDGRDWGGAVGQVTGEGAWAWEWRSVTWDGARFVTVGSGGAMAVSSDASSWHLPVVGTESSLYGVASDGGAIVAVGAGGVIVRSADGQTAPVVDPGNGQNDLLDVAWGHQLFVAVGDHGTVRTSPDGSVWTDVTSGTEADLRGVRAIEEGFVAVGSEGVVLTSADGSQWRPLGTADGGQLWDVISTGPDLVAVGDLGVVFRTACASEDEPPVARFAWRPTLAEAGTAIGFVDLSAGSPTSWHWEFGDGGSADVPAVSHVFTVAGDWPVTLTVSNDSGSSSATADVTVRPFCGAPPPAEVTAPASVASDESYEVSWTDTLEPHEFGETLIEEANNPAFDDSWGLWSPPFYTAHTFSHPWTEGASFFYRVWTINYCLDGSYRSPASEVVRVDVEPDLEQLGDHVSVIPAAAHGPGLERTSWLTDVVIHNPGEHDAPAYLVLLPRDGGGEPVTGERLWIEPDQSMLLEDAVGGLASPGYGALLVASDRPLMVSSRTYNDQPEGTFGQCIPGMPVVDGVAAGDEVRLIQLTHDARYRTNLGLANPTPDDATVEMTLHRADGELLGTRSYELEGLSSLMDVEVFAEVGASEVADGYAVLSSDSSGASYAAFASVVDNASGDPVALTALRDRWRHRAVTRSDVPVLQDQQQWRHLIDAGGVYVALSRDSLAWSVDGLDWRIGWEFDGWWDAASGLAWNGRQVVAVGDEWAYASPDGISWTRSALDGLGFWSVTWNGSRWAALGVVDGERSVVGFSDDGLTWNHTILDGIRVHTILWAGDRYVAFGPSGLAFSADGYQWRVTDQVDLWIEAVAWNGQQLMVVGQQDIFTSTDFFTFERQTLDWQLDGVVWAGDRWVVSASGLAWGSAGAFLVSVDGRSWEEVPRPGAPYPARPLAWDGSLVLTIDYRRTVSWLVGDGDEVIVPAAAHLPGYGGSRWRTDLQLHNPNGEPQTCTVELLERDAANGQPRSLEFELDPASSRRLEDVVGDALGFLGAAALRIRPDIGAVMVSSRTYDDADDGTYGQLVPGMRRSEAVWPFEIGRLIQLRHSPWLGEGFRTNIGLVSACDDPMEVAVDLFLGSGERLGTATVALPPRGVTQLNNVFEPWTDGAVDDGFAILSSVTPRCAFHAFASVVDNRSNDPILVPVKPSATVSD